MADEIMVSLDEACFLGNETLIKSHVPFDFTGKSLVHPIRISMVTVRRIVHHNELDWFEKAIELMVFIQSRHKDLKPSLYNSIMIRMKRMVILYEIVCDMSLSKKQGSKAIDKYFPFKEDPERKKLMEVLTKPSSKVKHDVRQGFSDQFKNDLDEYFQELEDKELPPPLSISECSGKSLVIMDNEATTSNDTITQPGLPSLSVDNSNNNNSTCSNITTGTPPSLMRHRPQTSSESSEENYWTAATYTPSSGSETPVPVSMDSDDGDTTLPVPSIDSADDDDNILPVPSMDTSSEDDYDSTLPCSMMPGVFFNNGESELTQRNDVIEDSENFISIDI